MPKNSYKSKVAHKNGLFIYSDEENSVWHDLVLRQKKILPKLACPSYLQGLDILDLPENRVPQLEEVNKVLQQETNFSVEPVPALISPQRFFELLSQRKFPAATFIRTREEFDYLEEPDIFHEIWGHCPLLTNQVYTDFIQKYGELALSLDKKYIWLMQRLFWFTVEFGLIDEGQGARIYGAGILSSAGESDYALHSSEAKRYPFNILNVFRTPYRIDIFQKVYFVIQSYNDLYAIIQEDLQPVMDQALALGMFKATFPEKEKKGIQPVC